MNLRSSRIGQTDGSTSRKGESNYTKEKEIEKEEDETVLKPESGT